MVSTTNNGINNGEPDAKRTHLVTVAPPEKPGKATTIQNRFEASSSRFSYRNRNSPNEKRNAQEVARTAKEGLKSLILAAKVCQERSGALQEALIAARTTRARQEKKKVMEKGKQKANRER